MQTSEEKLRVPVAPIRKAVLEYLRHEKMSYAELARRLGWIDKRGKADTSRLLRMLGLRARRGEKRSTEIQEANAVMLVEAIDKMPVEFNL